MFDNKGRLSCDISEPHECALVRFGQNLPTKADATCAAKANRASDAIGQVISADSQNGPPSDRLGS
jgi:hypothetical protein